MGLPAVSGVDQAEGVAAADDAEAMRTRIPLLPPPWGRAVTATDDAEALETADPPPSPAEIGPRLCLGTIAGKRPKVVLGGAGILTLRFLR